MSTLIDAADALVTVLNTASRDDTLSQTFTATRKYVPRVELKDMDTLHVTVVPLSTHGMVVNRGRGKQQFFEFDVGVQKRSTETDPDDDDDTFDALVTLIEELDTLLLGQTLTVGSLTLIGSTQIGGEDGSPRTVCLSEHLDQWRQFTSVSRFSFKVVT